ncbi:MAG: hypothetical protein AAB428_01255 [Patescibacteria group bacterium]
MRFSFKQAGIPQGEYENYKEVVTPYIFRLQKISQSGSYAEPESSICLVSDESILAKAREVYKDKVGKPLKYVAVVGIGGSNLGTMAVYEATVGYNLSLREDKNPRVIFFDNSDERFASLALEHILKNTDNHKEIVVVIISKSGGTVETMANAEYLIQNLRGKFPQIEERMIVVTDDGNLLQKRASNLGITNLSVPVSVGGRYSVFSADGLTPLVFAGADISAFTKGALEMREACLSSDLDENPAFRGAVFLAYWYGRGKIIHDVFSFVPELEVLGKWYRQLLGESIGKSEDIGISPTVSIGSADLHSVGQLNLGGPKNKTTLFIENSAKINGENIENSDILGQNIDFIKGKSLSDIMQALTSGAMMAYESNGLSFAEVFFDGISEEEIGAFMEWKMIETMILGNILGVNAFDQPAVESYKKETERILKK